MPRLFGEIPYTLSAIIIAAYNPVADTYGTPVVVADGQMVVTEPEHDTDKMRGYGKNTRGLSVPVGAKVNVKGGGFDTASLTIMGNLQTFLSGTTPNQVRRGRVPAGGSGMPYFGVIGTAPAEGGGLFVIGHRAVMLDSFPKLELNGETNKFSVHEGTGYSFPMLGYLEYPVQYETASDWTAPASGANFKTFFTTIEAL